MSWSAVLAIARAEARLTRRLARYWVFMVLAFVLSLVAFLYYCTLHGLFSSYSATVSSIGPRWLVAAVGQYFVLIMMVGLVFLGFDLLGRDRRERVVEVMDSRPFTNLELVFGRFLGVLLPAWLPVVVLAVVIQGLGWALPRLGAPIGEPTQPWSMVGLVFQMALPAFAFTLGMVFLVTVLVRHRLAAAILSIAVLGGMFFAAVWLPISWGPLFDIVGAYQVDFPSDLVPRIADAVGWSQRGGVLIAALGLVALAAALHPRLDGGSKPRAFAVAGGVILLGVAVLAGCVGSRFADIRALDTWEAAHAARAETPSPDVRSVTGRVDVDPGRRLALDLELEVAAPAGESLDSLLFSFNPGLRVTAVEGAGGALRFDQADGLLEVWPGAPVTEATPVRFRVAAEGRPDRRFGYLDSAKTPEKLTPREAQLFLLGYERSVFRSRFVALSAGGRWLPVAGPDVGRADPRRRPRDPFVLDLEVTVPDGWTPAAPGRRQDTGEPGTFRFAPVAPVDSVALVAGRFESFAADIDGVRCELLVAPKHSGRLQVFAAAKDEIEDWIRDRLEGAARSGLGYPYDGFTMVEVPTVLRGFAGGWRMDTALAPSAMLLVKESGLPTARFDLAFDEPEDFEDVEGGMPAAMRDRLATFVLNDFSGGSLQVGAARSFFHHLVAPAGPAGLALDFVLDELTTLQVFDTRGYFSAHMFGPEMQQAIGSAISGYFAGGRQDGDFASAVIRAFTSRPEVWDAVLGRSLVDLDTQAEPQRAFDALTLKAGALARSLHDELGAEHAGELLARLRADHLGGRFELSDVVAAAEAVGEPGVGQLFEDWLTTTELPGFVAQRAEAFRLSDGEGGAPRYQLEVEIRNDEPVAGMVRVETVVGEEASDRETLESELIRVDGRSAVRWGRVLSRPPTSVSVVPYLSLNRGPFVVPLDEIDAERITNVDAFAGVEPIEWRPGDDDAVIVDDLDDGFRVTGEADRRGLRLGARDRDDAEMDQGLPRADFRGVPRVWSRAEAESAWGRYRHTMAVVRSGSGAQQAEMTAELPSPGPWQLEVHLPDKRRFGRSRTWGSWTLRIRSSGEPHEVAFDAGTADRGWNLVGAFELPAGEVTVVFGNDTDGDLVVADAVRWTPASERAIAEAGR